MKTVFGIDPQEKSILKRRFFIPRMPWPRQRRAGQSKDELGSAERDQEEKRMSDAEAGMSPRSQFYKLNNGSALDLSRPNTKASIHPASHNDSGKHHVSFNSHPSTSITITLD